MPPISTLEDLGAAFALTAPVERKRMLVIVNPYATTVSDRLRHLVVYALQGRYEVEAIDTAAKLHAVQLAREAAQEGFDVVVAFGGDGTVNETANGLAGSDTPMTTLPGGATNVFARMLGIPNDIVDATEHLLRMADDFQPRAIDLARVDDRWFTFSAGLGLDAAVVERVDARPKLKARYGPVYYGASAVNVFARKYAVSPPQLSVEVDGAELARGVTAFVQNGDPYTYTGPKPLHLAENSRLDSGRLAGAVLTRARLTDMPSIMFRALSEKAPLSKARAVEGFSDAREIVVRSTDGRALPLQVDGDHIGDVLEARFSVRPNHLRVVS